MRKLLSTQVFKKDNQSKIIVFNDVNDSLNANLTTDELRVKFNAS